MLLEAPGGSWRLVEASGGYWRLRVLEATGGPLAGRELLPVNAFRATQVVGE